MIKTNILTALNAQINMEYHSSYSYLAMSKFFLEQNLNGFATWMRVQAQEELAHGMRIFDFVNERDGSIHFGEIQQPRQEWASAQEAFEEALANERNVSESIYALIDLALSERDHATNAFLQWFVSEQVEEESSIKEVIDTLKLVGKDGNGVFILDRDLAQRTFPLANSGSTTPDPNTV
ncbi:MAG: ferritin [bacterium]|nr:ferritin [bacterium]